MDGIRSVSRLFIPEGSQGGFRSLDLSSACLALSKRLRIGSGVIRILEHDPNVLASRLLTLQELSSNRFIFGIGTGPVGDSPGQKIKSMLERLSSTRESFRKFAEAYTDVKMPETFVATLRKGIANAVANHSDGILLNFCPPEHAREVVSSLSRSVAEHLTVSCFLKLFYSRNEDTARRMLIEELAVYNRNPSYHKMFKSAGVADEIARASSALARNEEIRLGEKLQKISLANPTRSELAAYVASFRNVGIDLPCPIHILKAVKTKTSG